MTRTASKALAGLWGERLRRWRQSRLSVAEFCRREQISQPSFFAWRRKLAKQHATIVPPGQASHAERDKPPTRRANNAGRTKLPAHDRVAGSPRFVQLPLAGRTPEPGASIQIALPSGAVVTLPQQAPLEFVVAVVRAVMFTQAKEDRPC